MITKDDLTKCIDGCGSMAVLPARVCLDCQLVRQARAIEVYNGSKNSKKSPTIVSPPVQGELGFLGRRPGGIALGRATDACSEPMARDT